MPRDSGNRLCICFRPGVAHCGGYGQAETRCYSSDRRPGWPISSPSPNMDNGGMEIAIYKAFYWKPVPMFKMFDGSKTGATVFKSSVGDASQKNKLTFSAVQCC